MIRATMIEQDHGVYYRSPYIGSDIKLRSLVPINDKDKILTCRLIKVYKHSTCARWGKSPEMQPSATAPRAKIAASFSSQRASSLRASLTCSLGYLCKDTNKFSSECMA